MHKNVRSGQFHLKVLIFTSETRHAEFLIIDKMNCELMLTYDTPALRQTGSRNLTDPKTLPTIGFTFLYPRSPKGEGDILFYLCPSVLPSGRPSKIFFVAFFSVTVDGDANCKRDGLAI
jgi:hypothetical protein